ncbi:hypothetical protein ACP275_08G200800 [Erythranthe tilingii]
MVNRFNGLPPLKRYSLIQQLNQETKNPKNITTTTPLCLPAKKRKQCLDSPPPPLPPPISTAICLPAKKRILAFHPFDLNLQYDDESEKSTAAQDPVNEDAAAADTDDDGVLCAVCESTDGDPTDPIVLCDGCDLMVHATCYGHPFTAGIPDGDWFCAQCLETKSGAKSAPKKACCLCPVAGGALKPTTDGRWAHLVCAIYVPEVFFADAMGREGIDCSKVLKRRWSRKCYICETKNGCAVDCSESKCALSFHVSCGLKEDLCVEYRDGRNNNNKVAVVAAFCAVHTDLWKKQEQTGKFKIVARDEDKN